MAIIADSRYLFNSLKFLKCWYHDSQCISELKKSALSHFTGHANFQRRRYANLWDYESGYGFFGGSQRKRDHKSDTYSEHPGGALLSMDVVNMILEDPAAFGGKLREKTDMLVVKWNNENSKLTDGKGCASVSWVLKEYSIPNSKTFQRTAWIMSLTTFGFTCSNQKEPCSISVPDIRVS